MCGPLQSCWGDAIFYCCSYTAVGVNVLIMCCSGKYCPCCFSYTVDGACAILYGGVVANVAFSAA